MAKCWKVALCGAWLLLTGPALAAEQDFSAWLTAFKAEALDKGLKPETIEATLADVQPIDRVIELDRKQPEFTLTFDDYLARVAPDSRIEKGKGLIKQHKALLTEVSKRYGVPANVIVAMWGIETDFGRVTGGFPVIPALATLAYDGRRSAYFRTELFNALTIVDKGLAPAERLRGSWAGAMGQCQFMPSTYLNYGQSWSGGAPDIWNIQADVFASAANYLSQIGWNPKEGWGRPVKLPKNGISASLVGLDVSHSLTQWGKLGLRQANGKPLPKSEMQASLIRAETGKNGDTGTGKPYLVTGNFRVIMKWNRSIFFALGAGTLADRLGSK